MKCPREFAEFIVAIQRGQRAIQIAMRDRFHGRRELFQRTHGEQGNRMA